jgi:hypothetical protein
MAQILGACFYRLSLRAVYSGFSNIDRLIQEDSDEDI